MKLDGWSSKWLRECLDWWGGYKCHVVVWFCIQMCHISIIMWCDNDGWNNENCHNLMTLCYCLPDYPLMTFMTHFLPNQWVIHRFLIYSYSCPLSLPSNPPRSLAGLITKSALDRTAQMLALMWSLYKGDYNWLYNSHNIISRKPLGFPRRLLLAGLEQTSLWTDYQQVSKCVLLRGWQWYGFSL